MTGDRIPLVDLGWQTAVINDHVQARWADLIGRSAFVLGDAVASFEAEYAHHTQVSHCIGVANGTDAIELLIRAAGIGVNVHYAPVYHHSYYRARGYGEGLCPSAEAAARQILTLPLFPAMTADDVARVVATLTSAMA